MTRRDVILDTIDDCVTDLLYYDRKDDESLPVGDIEAAVAAGEITLEDMVACFSKALDGSSELAAAVASAATGE